MSSSNSIPNFRFVQMQQEDQQQQSETTSTKTSVIDKNSFFSHQQPSLSAAAAAASSSSNHPPNKTRSQSLWNPTELRTVPAFYPLEKSSRLVEDDTPANVAARLADCLRRYSIQAVYENDTAHLHSSDHVDMHLSLWLTPPTSPQTGIVVELQRRSGDSIAFHRYARSILDAAMGLLEYDDVARNEQQQSRTTTDRTPTTRADGTLAETPPLLGTQYSKKVQRLLRSVSGGGEEEYETALQAIEIAHGLLMKDRMDAQVLGLESLCLLTDPQKAGTITSVLTAHVVLLGSTQNVQDDVQLPNASSSSSATPSFHTTDEGPFVEIRESILNLVQFSRIGQPDDDDDDASVATDPPADDEQHLKLLHHLALAVLANALHVLEHPPLRTHTRTRTRSADIVADQFVSTILPTLVTELGQAKSLPHAATLSAKCLGSLVRASDAARRRAKELGAKQVVQTALEVGTATHLRLQLESQKLSQTLAEEPNTAVATVVEEGKQEEEDDDDETTELQEGKQEEDDTEQT